jgi:hypothetical protein
MKSIAVHQSKHSERVMGFIELSIEKLAPYCSKKYAKLIIAASENGNLYGLHLTKLSKIRAIFV